MSALAHNQSGVIIGRARFSPDGQTLYYQTGIPGTLENRIVGRDLASGNEREVVHGKLTFRLAVSPDGRQLVCSRRDANTKTESLVAVPVAGGEPRQLARVRETEGFGFTTFSPDGQYLLFRKSVPAGESTRAELWRVAASGGEPQKIDVGGTQFRDFAIHPDGQRIAFTAGDPKQEVWVMENFLPLLSAKR